MIKFRELMILILSLFITGGSMTYTTPKVDIGHPSGLIPDCPGVMKNATISSRMMPSLQIVVHGVKHGKTYRKSLPILAVAKTLARDKIMDFKHKKTVIYAVGFLDSAALPYSKAMANAYIKRGYNVFVTETFRFLSYIYPKSVRLSRTIGRKLGELLVKLTKLGLKEKDLELVGISLGAHTLSYAAKYFYEITGKKPSLIAGLDPAGPCFRSLPPEERLQPSDAEKVVVLHTNIDGFGIAEPLGHVDFYANGGEYQPNDILYIPCLVLCSHIRAITYWWQAVENPRKFVGVKCDSVQSARLANCYNNTEYNVLGIETDFNKPGLYYLSTNNVFPYYRGEEGLKAENEIYTSLIKTINSDEFVV